MRATPAAVWASAACSVGRNTLTSPDEGFNVPTTATTIIGQKVVTPANPSPVTSISAAAPTQDPPAGEAIAEEAHRQGDRRRAEQRPGDDGADRDRAEAEARQVGRQHDADDAVGEAPNAAREEQLVRVRH